MASIHNFLSPSERAWKVTGVFLWKHIQDGIKEKMTLDNHSAQMFLKLMQVMDQNTSLKIIKVSKKTKTLQEEGIKSVFEVTDSIVWGDDGRRKWR